MRQLKYWNYDSLKKQNLDVVMHVLKFLSNNARVGVLQSYGNQNNSYYTL